MPNLINLESQQVEAHPDENLSTLLSSGKYDLPQGSSINVMNPKGELVSLPSEEVFNAVNKYGYRFPSSEQIKDFDAEAKYGKGMGNSAKAFGLGAARAATFGASDYLADPEAAKELEKRHPLATGLGEGAGVLGSVLLAPELSPVGLAGKTGVAIGEKVAPIAAKAASALANPETAPLASKVLQMAGEIGAKSIGSAVEGAAYGLGKSVSEDALGDHGLNGEKLLSNVGYGALFGGALGAGFESARIAIPKSVELAKQGMSKLYDVAVGLPGEEAGLGLKAYAKAASFVSGKPEENILYGIQNRLKSLTSPEEQEAITSDFANGLKDQAGKLNRALYDANSKIRPEETSKYLENFSTDLVKSEFDGAVSKIGDAISQMRSEPDLYPASYPRILEQIGERISKEAQGFKSASDVFNSLDNLKGRLDEEISYGLTPGPGDQRAQKIISALRLDLKKSLENEGTWGQAAARQAAFNDAQAQFLNLTGKKGAFRKDFMAPALGKSGKQIYEVSPSKVKTFLSQINDLRGEAKAKSLQGFLDASNNLISEIEQSYKALPDKEFDKAALETVLNKNQDFAHKAVEQAEYRKMMGGINAGAHNVPLAEMGAIGATLGHHPGVGAAMESWAMLKDPYLAMQRLAKIERATQKITNSIEKTAGVILKVGSNVAEPLKGLAAQRLIPKFDHDDAIAKINELNGNPNKLMDSLQKNTESLYDHAPKIAQSMMTSAAMATGFLGSKVPRGTLERAPLSQEYKPSAAELAKFQRYYKTVNDPLSAFDDLKMGLVTPESIETLQTVYPKMYGEMKQALMNKLVDHMAKKNSAPIAYRTKLALSQFMQMDLDNSLKQVNIQANQIALSGIQMQNNIQEQMVTGSIKPTAKGLGKVDLSGRMKTSAQKSLGRET